MEWPDEQSKIYSLNEMVFAFFVIVPLRISITIIKRAKFAEFFATVAI